MPSFNKDKYITDESYEVPWRSLEGTVNQESRVRVYLETLEDNGYVEWDDYATVTDLDSSDWGISHGFGTARSIVVVGTDTSGEEVVFVKAVRFSTYPFRPGPPYTSSSFIYAGGQRLSPNQLSQRLKLGKKGYKEYRAREAEKKEEKGWSTRLQKFVTKEEEFSTREDLDWS